MSFQTFQFLLEKVDVETSSSHIQVTLMPISFGLLFSLMLLYWGQAALFSYTKYKKVTTILFFSCIVSLTLLLICRFLDSGHLPLSNLYESLLFLSWSFLVLQLFLQLNSNWKNPFTVQTHTKREVTADLLTDVKTSSSHIQDQFIHFLGVITSPMSLLTYGFAFLNLPKEMQKSTSLVPALQSNWLMMHVTVMILSYAALLCGSIFSMAFLLLTFLEKREENVVFLDQLEKKTLFPTSTTQTQPNAFDNVSYLLQTEFNQNQMVFTDQNVVLEENVVFLDQDEKNKGNKNKVLSFIENQPDIDRYKNEAFAKGVIPATSLSLAAKLDNYSYRVLSLGFPLLTIGILSGAVWANQAWGSYWSWDPKESWALITWLVFAIYLHARITKGWSGQKPAMIATFGFFVVWFCYLGVNLLGAGLHSYGWFSK